jgi:sigma54-dependent transcription regulator
MVIVNDVVPQAFRPTSFHLYGHRLDLSDPVVAAQPTRRKVGDDVRRSRAVEDVLGVCRTAGSLSAAGRVLFDRSRERKKVANDADRLRKYLARFDLEWSEIRERLRQDY